MKPEPSATAKDEKISLESGSRKSKIHPRPISISSSSGKPLSGFPLKSTKTAKEAIYDNAGVGADLRPPKPIHPVSPAKFTPRTYLKPTGVDDPAETKPSNEATSNSNMWGDDEVIPGARNSKVKRQRQTNPDEEGAKRNKKKKKAVN